MKSPEISVLDQLCSVIPLHASNKQGLWFVFEGRRLASLYMPRKIPFGLGYYYYFFFFSLMFVHMLLLSDLAQFINTVCSKLHKRRFDFNVNVLMRRAKNPQKVVTPCLLSRVDV